MTATRYKLGRRKARTLALCGGAGATHSQGHMRTFNAGLAWILTPVWPKL